MDTERIAAEFLRALRAHRSQVQWSRWLGYRSNVAYAWESGRRWPTAAETFRAAGRAGIDVREALRLFYGELPAHLEEVDPAEPASIAWLLRDLKGRGTVTELADRTGVSRFSASRWLAGRTQPRLPDFLAVVEGASVRLVDFLTSFVAPEQLPSIMPLYQRIEARRKGAFDAPWTQAVLRALELSDYTALPSHREGWIAERLRIPVEEERRCIAYMELSGQVKWTGTHWAQEVVAVDTRRNPQIGRHLKGHWSSVARERIGRGSPGQFSYNVFSVSDADFERIREAHLAYFHALRAIVAESEPGERVAVANVQLFALDAPWDEAP